jgi:TrmH family RNA methyltransferase
MAADFKQAPGGIQQTLTHLNKLQDSAQFRKTSETFFVEGIRNFICATDFDWQLSRIVFSEKLLTSPLARKMVRALRRQGIPTTHLTPGQFRQISRTKRASGVAAIVKQSWLPLVHINPQNDLCWLVLGQIRSHGNLGTLIRTSEAAGGAGLILVDSRTDPYHPTVLRASMGSVFNQHFVRTNLAELARWKKMHSLRLAGASPAAVTNFQEHTFNHTSLLFLGEERQGLTPAQQAICDDLVRIPMFGQADSLNVGVAGGLLVYEVLRQRKMA